jgi:hypothetical protein
MLRYAVRAKRVKLGEWAQPGMRTDYFSEESLRRAYEQAADVVGVDFSEFAEGSSFDFSLAINVECDTGLPVSTPAELREKKFQQKLKQSQSKANKIADRQRKVAEALAKKMTRKMRQEMRLK